MIEIIPAILPKSFSDLTDHLEAISEYPSEEERAKERYVQIDVVDGVYAANKTWPYTEPASFEKILLEEEGLPRWEEFDFEFDCMLSRPEEEIEKYIRAGASRVVLHARDEHLKNTLTMLQEYRVGALPTELGVALLPGDSLELLAPLVEMYDYVQVMGIARVGFQHEPFDERALNLITSLRQQFPELTIQVDGGVRESNAQKLATAGASRLVVGSAIFSSPDPLREIETLAKRANSRVK